MVGKVGTRRDCGESSEFEGEGIKKGKVTGEREREEKSDWK